MILPLLSFTIFFFLTYIAVRKHVREFDFKDPSVTLVSIGGIHSPLSLHSLPPSRSFCADGSTPRVASLFAFMTRWRCISVDPLLPLTTASVPSSTSPAPTPSVATSSSATYSTASSAVASAASMWRSIERLELFSGKIEDYHLKVCVCVSIVCPSRCTQPNVLSSRCLFHVTLHTLVSSQCSCTCAINHSIVAGTKGSSSAAACTRTGLCRFAIH
jgi:hypothetical protein